jgi:hypothetical protein
MSPPFAVGSLVKVHISCNAIDFVESETYFEYDQPPVVVAVNPSFGTLFGGMEVTIYGQHFRDTEQFACTFGHTRKVRMRWHSGQLATLVTPTSLAPGNITLQATNDGVTFSSSSMPFQVVSACMYVAMLWRV